MNIVLNDHPVSGSFIFFLCIAFIGRQYSITITNDENFTFDSLY